MDFHKQHFSVLVVVMAYHPKHAIYYSPIYNYEQLEMAYEDVNRHNLDAYIVHQICI